MNLTQIQYFLELARELHFWNAAGKMNITQSSLSRQIRALEEELGVQLFERNKRNVRLTPAGVFLREEWQRLLTEIDNIHLHGRRISDGEAGEIKIGHIGSVAHSMLPELMRVLSRQYPQLTVMLFEWSTEKIEEALLEFKIDVGLRREPSGNKRLETLLVNKEPFALAVPDDHPSVRRGFGGLDQLKDETFILPPLHNRNGYTESLLHVFQQYGFYPKTRFESDFGSTILSLVSKGLGISVMPFSYSHSAPPGVRFIRLPHQTGLYLITRKNDLNPIVPNILKMVTTIAGSQTIPRR
jgi:DNA-binding transcriptional LysR family regulator